VFEPSQFLTTAHIKSYFSCLTRSQRLHGNPTQSQKVTTIEELNEEAIEEAEKEFDSVVSDLHEQSIMSIAKKTFRKAHENQSELSTSSQKLKYESDDD
jgi:hypothetical protein